MNCVERHAGRVRVHSGEWGHWERRVLEGVEDSCGQTG